MATPEATPAEVQIPVADPVPVVVDQAAQLRNEVESINTRAMKLRCTLSKRLMVSPVMASDGYYYDQRVLEANPSISTLSFTPAKRRQEKIRGFSKASLTKLEAHLMQENTPDELFGLTAECLAVLDIEDEMVDKVLGRVEGATMQRLLGKLREFMPLESLISLMNQKVQKLPAQVLSLMRLFILDRPTEAAFEQAFTCLVSQAALNAGAIDLAEEVVERLTSSQQAQLNAALSSNPRAGELEERLGRLRLKEASLKLREGNNEAAISIVKSLRMSPGLEEEALRFYVATSCINEKLLILKQRLSASIQVLNSENPKTAQALNLLQQVLDTELESLRKEDNTLKRDLNDSLQAVRTELASSKQPNLDSLKTELNDSLQVLRSELTSFKQTDFDFLKTELNSSLQSLRSELVSFKQTDVDSLKTELKDSLQVLRSELDSLKQSDVETLKRELNDSLKVLHTELASLKQSDIETLKRELNDSLQVLHSELTSLKHSDFESLKRELNDSASLLHATQKEVEQLNLFNGILSPPSNPLYIYSIKYNSNELHRTNLQTGEDTLHRVGYKFNYYSCWSELPEGGLLVTGGSLITGECPLSDVVSIDTETYEAAARRPMMTARGYHASVYDKQHLYILGGSSGRRTLSECERYVCAEDRWEELPPLPSACQLTSAVVMDRTLYALGGYTTTDLDLIQVLSLDWLLWRSARVLPTSGKFISCFKVSDTQAYFVLNKNLYSFKPQQTVQLQPVKLLTQDILSKRGPSYYSRGTLYCSNDEGAARRLRLSN
jgi:ABC-type methionine transport system ATPase subunit